MSQPNDNQLEGWIKYIILWMDFRSTSKYKYEPDVINIFEEKKDFPLSKTLFPCIMRVYNTGSRAEKTNLPESDHDRMFEIGPGLVSLKKFNGNQQPNRFYCKETKNKGFYHILDNEDEYLYPKVIQIKAGSILHPQKELVLDGKALKAAVTNGEEDQVLAMRLEEWPPNFLQNKIEWFNKDRITGIKDSLSI